jgi:hypothetical protein
MYCLRPCTACIAGPQIKYGPSGATFLGAGSSAAIADGAQQIDVRTGNGNAGAVLERRAKGGGAAAAVRGQLAALRCPPWTAAPARLPSAFP